MIIYLNDYRKKVNYTDNTDPDLFYNIENDHQNLLNTIGSYDTKFKLPYILSKYPKNANILYSLYEELQKSLFFNKNKFDKWIIEFCKCNIHEIIANLNKEIVLITNFITKYDRTHGASCHSIINRHQYYLDGYVSFLNNCV